MTKFEWRIKFNDEVQMSLVIWYLTLIRHSISSFVIALFSQPMPQLQPLRLQVPLIVLARHHLYRYVVDDAQAVSLQAVNLLGVVGHDADLADAEVAKDLRADAVIALVDWQAQPLVRLDRIQPLLLQLVGVQLV